MSIIRIIGRLTGIGLMLVVLSAPAFGETPVLCGTADDTAAVQAAIDAGGPVLLPVGVCAVSTLDARNRPGLMIRGQGQFVSHLTPISPVNAVLDLRGSAGAILEHFSLGDHQQAVLPNTAILLGITAVQDAAGQNSIDRVRLNNLFITGRYAVSALYVHGTASSMCSASRFWNFYEAHPVATVFTSTDRYGLVPPTTSRWVADWTFVGCEFHSGRNGATGGAPAIVLDGASSFRFYGGNMASPVAPIVWANLSHTLLFDWVGFYSDYGPTPSCAVQSAQSSSIELRGGGVLC